ncbi:hypothetical protein PTT_17457 [Pyrenophora teres f. teres 0-1]|uniref:Uncharacterized protein n=1 Tax=Pyrenophora teres f. teres (strain 0-1) TaxID=861557 RepID=E3S4H6_PYRTT|nr:hypothetical protein PTT_17457 [Pyrenophora teres f. teres 0-1]
MAGHRAFTYDDQTAHLHASTSRPSQVSGSSSVHTEASVSTRLTPHLSQQSPGFDLFATLLFDRRRAYQSVSSASSGLRAISTSTPTGPDSTTRPALALNLRSDINVHSTRRETPRNDEISMLEFKDRTKTPAGSRKRERPAEAPTRMTTVKHQKPNPPSRFSPRLAKLKLTLKMTEANSKKKVDNKADTMAKRGKRILSDVIVISSNDENDDEVPMLPHIDSDIDEDVKPVIADIEPTSRVTESISGRMPLENVSQLETWGLSSVSPERVPSSGLAQDNHQKELARVKSEHAQEMEQMRQELDAARKEIERIQQLHDTEVNDWELEHVRAINLAESRCAATEHNLENEQKEIVYLTRENESLRIQVDKIEAECGVLVKERADEKAQRTKEKKEHEKVLEDVTKAKAAEMESATKDLLSKNQQLLAENEPESQKDDNIRKVYIRTKRRFDNLQSVAMQLVHCTRNMDLSAWGEFGKCVGKMKEALSEGKTEGVR